MVSDEILKTENYKRDEHSGALLATNTNDFARYKATKTQREKVRSLERSVNELKDDMQEIKNLLRECLSAPK